MKGRPQDIVTEAKSKFKELDTDNNGVLDPEELGGFVEWVCSKFHPAHAGISEVRKASFKQELLERVDLDNDGRLDWNEFISFVAMLSSPLKEDRKQEGSKILVYCHYDDDYYYAYHYPATECCHSQA